MTASMLNLWDYAGIDDACYSDTDQEPYRKAAAFLGDTVEDWGCGTGWARRYFTDYRGIDGSPSTWVAVDDVVDLVHYRSRVPNILCKLVLEYNTEWATILDNITASFTQRFCAVVATPEADETHIHSWLQLWRHDGRMMDAKIPEVWFRRQDIRDVFPATIYRVEEEVLATRHEYGSDWILYVERR